MSGIEFRPIPPAFIGCTVQPERGTVTVGRKFLAFIDQHDDRARGRDPFAAYIVGAVPTADELDDANAYLDADLPIPFRLVEP